MSMSSGLGALIRLGASVELDSNLQTIFIGAPEPGVYTTTFVGCPERCLGADYELETAGHFLLYRIAIVSQGVHVSASPLDSINVPELLLKTEDNENGWRLALAFISSLEKFAVCSLERPILVGDPLLNDPAECWIVG